MVVHEEQLHSAKIAKLRQQMNSWGGEGRAFFFLIDFEMQMPRLWSLDALPADLLLETPGFCNYLNGHAAPKDFLFEFSPPALSDFSVAYAEVMEQIRAGNSYLLNLTFPSRLETDLSLADIFYSSRAKYKLLFGDRFVVFSPETFVSIRKNKIYTYPMKGTIDASLPDAENKLLSNHKEFAEHNTIVDLLRNDLSMVSTGVEVEHFRYVERINSHRKSLLQTSSVISGNLESDFRKKIGDLIFTMLPAGSVSGAPKAKTLKIIRSAESGKRGYYTGVMGVFDGENLDSAVMIRFIEQGEDALYYRSGGGITAMSDMEEEYRELTDKIYVPFD